MYWLYKKMVTDKIVAVVVTYNRKDLLLECIKCLINQKGIETDILVVDNASTDGTADTIAEYVELGKIIYVNTGSNLGGAGGFCFGINKAVELGYEYIWLMDDDTFAKPSALKELIDTKNFLNNDFGFLSSIAYWSDGNLCNMNKQKYTISKKLETVPQDIETVMMASFVSFFVKTSTVRKLGLPIKEFFIWADDLEYSRRISKEMPCYVVPTSIVEHHMSSNNRVGIESESEDRLWRYEYLYRNEVYLYKREGFKGIVYLFLRFMLHNVRILLKSNGNRMNKLKVIWKSFIRGFSFHPPIEYIKD